MDQGAVAAKAQSGWTSKVHDSDHKAAVWTSKSADFADIGLSDVKSMLQAVEDTYTVDVVSVQTLPQHHFSILQIEGCAQCLSAAVTSSSARVVVLCCKLLECKHIIHLECLIKAINNASAPRLLHLHSTSFFRAIPFARASASSLLVSRDAQGSRRFNVEITMTHVVSSAPVLMVAPQGVPTFVDARHEYLLLSLNTSGLLSTVGAVPSDVNFATFAVARGQITFRCVDTSSHQVFSHVCNYDLSPAQELLGSGFALKLVLVDARTSDVLTLGVHRIAFEAPEGKTAPPPLFALSHIKYDFAPHTFAASATAATASAAAAASAQAKLGISVGSPPGSPVAGSQPAFFVIEPYSPLHLQQQQQQQQQRSMHQMRGGHAHGHHGFGQQGQGQFRPMMQRAQRGPLGSHGGGAGMVVADNGMAQVQQVQAHGQNSPLLQSVPAPRFGPSRGFAVPKGAAAGAAAAGSVPTAAAAGVERKVPAASGPAAASKAGPAGTVAKDKAASAVSASSQSAAASASGATGAGAGAGAAGAGGRARTSSLSATARDWTPNKSAASAADSESDSEEEADEKVLSDDEPDFDNRPRSPFVFELQTAASTSGAGAGASAGAAAVSSPMIALSAEQCAHNVVRLAKTHAGSRFLQTKLDTRDSPYFAVCFAEIKDNMADLCIDNFGHFAVEKLISLASEDQCMVLLKQLAPSMAMVACQKHGSFSVQALVDALRSPDQMQAFVESCLKDVVQLILHPSGHFVILRMLQKLPYAATKFIDEALRANCLQVATDHHGLRVLKAVMATRRSAELARLFKQISRLTLKLVENQYGNYAIQAVLELAPAKVRTSVKRKMEGKYTKLSKQKFSSNVVERCLKLSSTHWRAIIIRELTAQDSVAELLKDRYGNYVLQTCLSVATPAQIQEIAKAVDPVLSTLRDNVRVKWMKMLNPGSA